MKKIVSIKFSDGTEEPVVGNIFVFLQYIEKYIETLPIQEYSRALAGANFDWDVQSKAADNDQKKRLTNKAIARRPRNEFAKRPDAKAALLAFKNQYVADHGTEHGWRSAACEKFLVDPATLRRVLAKKITPKAG